MQIGPLKMSWRSPGRVSDMIPSERVSAMRVTGTGIMGVLRDGDIDVDDLKSRLSYYEELRTKNKAFATLRDNLAWMELRADLEARIDSLRKTSFWTVLTEPRRAVVDAIEALILDGLISITDEAAEHQFDTPATIKAGLRNPAALLDEEE